MENSNKKMGYGIVFLGVILLTTTFFLGLYTLLNPDFIEEFSDLITTEGDGIAALVDMLIYIIPVLLLFVMGSIGGRIIKHGLNLIKIPDQTGRKNLEKKKVPASSQKTNKKKDVSPPPRSPPRFYEESSSQEKIEEEPGKGGEDED